MEIVYFISLLTVLLIAYYVSNNKLKRLEYVKCVEAGPTAKVTANDLHRLSFEDNYLYLKDDEGHPVHRDRMIRVVVKGDCMHCRHIVNGTQLLVASIDKNRSLKEQIKHGSILMIHIPDTNVDKIREMDHMDDKNVYTFYYDPDGTKHKSSRPHAIDTVVGVVRYRI